MLPPVARPDGASRIGSFTRITDPVIDREAVSADIIARSGVPVDGKASANQAAVYHVHMLKAGGQWWQNADYLVQATLSSSAGFAAINASPVLWLRIYRHDGQRLLDHWQALQAIKSELVGPEFEAVEIYPKESRLKDGENSYHLWVPLGWPLPFGLPGGRSATADGIPAVSTRFVRPGKPVQAPEAHCRLVASGIDVSEIRAACDGRKASDGYMLPSGLRHVLAMTADEKAGIEVAGGLVGHLLDAIEPHVGRPRIQVLNLLTMAPGDIVPDHVDPPRPEDGMPIRMHLVIAAEPGCEFRIGGETIEHRTGDLWQIRGTDNVLHGAENRSDGDRVIACFNVDGATVT